MVPVRMAREKTAVFSTTSTHTQQLLVGSLLFAGFALCLALVQFATPALVGTDGYYHSKMGYLIRQEGLTPRFDALPFTILNADAYYDHHLLYHLYLALFAPVDPAVDGGVALTLGAKIASVLLPAAAFTAVWWLLRQQRVPYAALWSLALLTVSEAFLYRMSMPRAQSLSLLLLVLGLNWLWQGKYRYLLPLGFVYVWAYNAFPLLLVLAGVFVTAVFLQEHRLIWPAIAYPAVGIALGLLINPYFPENITFIYGHLLPKLGESAVKVGNEWSPYQTATLLDNSGFALLLLGLGLLGMAWHKRRSDQQTVVALLLTLLFGYMLMESRRFIEYFPPFVVIFAALSLAPLLRLWRTKWQKRPFLLPLLLSLALLYPLYSTLTAARQAVADSKPADRYADAALWLRQHSEPQSRIFQTDWDDFTRLFFYNSDAIYTVGLDPTFMELHDPDLFTEWRAITRGRVAQPSGRIKALFGSDYVFSDLNHDDFLEEAAKDPGLIEIYRDDDAVIFAVR